MNPATFSCIYAESYSILWNSGKQQETKKSPSDWEDPGKDRSAEPFIQVQMDHTGVLGCYFLHECGSSNLCRLWDQNQSCRKLPDLRCVVFSTADIKFQDV